ncbi:MAG TPA: TMEM43 family protein [Thermoanaerobaculia bacterium]|nr:TMEM43 family protein [Thermoanaerobaculia bacterium]
MDRRDGGGNLVEVTRESWPSRLRGAVSGVVVGLVLLLVATVLLFWGEGRAVRRAQALKEGARTVQQLSHPAPDPERDRSLVHVVGRAITNEVLEDPALGVRAQALKLRRSVDMYQWQEDTRTEERTKVGGGKEKVKITSYEETWSSGPIDSSRFEEPAGHGNPPFPISGEEWVASGIRMGELALGEPLTARLNRWQSLSPEAATAERARALLGQSVTVSGDGLYVGADPVSPKVGDLRIRHDTVPPAEVSIVAELRGSSLETYRTTNGGSISLLEYGRVTADDIFSSASTGNRMMTWSLRLAGFVLFLIGFGAIMRPLSVLADVIPPVGRLIGAGLGAFSFGLAAISSLVVVAIGWMFYRPVLAIALLAVAVVVIVWLFRRGGRKLAAATAVAPAPATAAAGAGASKGPPPDLPPIPGRSSRRR